METVEVSTVVYVPPAEAYSFVLDFPRYAAYSEHLEGVTQIEGDGSPGTRYDLTFSWWKLSYTARSEVTAVDPPERIDWRVVKDVDANGAWLIEPEDVSVSDDGEPATRVTLRVEFAPDSTSARAFDLPAFVSLDWVVDRVAPKIEAEARQVVRRIVADLEGDERPVDLDIQTSS